VGAGVVGLVSVAPGHGPGVGSFVVSSDPGVSRQAEPAAGEVAVAALCARGTPVVGRSHRPVPSARRSP
jgi:hypothetical protein